MVAVKLYPLVSRESQNATGVLPTPGKLYGVGTLVCQVIHLGKDKIEHWCAFKGQPRAQTTTQAWQATLVLGCGQAV